VKQHEKRATVDLVRRRCLACSAEEQREEPPDTDEVGPACAACGAPTERVAVLRTGIVPKSPHAVALGKLGGAKGGRARADALSPRRRRQIAQLAARARWKRS
jgi:hypothetical protein